MVRHVVADEGFKASVKGSELFHSFFKSEMNHETTSELHFSILQLNGRFVMNLCGGWLAAGVGGE
jgi:hypothetical protein